MKKFCLTSTIAVSLLIFSTGIQGQTTQTQLDEVKLIQQFIGTWQRDVGQDSIAIWEIQQHNKAFVSNEYRVFGGKKSLHFEMIWSFYPKEGKSKGYILYDKGGYQTWNGSFTSEKKWSGSYLRDFNPEAVVGTWDFVLDTPSSIVVTSYNTKGEKTWEGKYHKIK